MLRKTCRSCNGKDLRKVLSLGNLYISNFVNKPHQGIKEPLDLVVCKNCSLVQLKHNAVDPNLLYRHYWYKSGMNKTMIDALTDIVQKIEKLVIFEPDDLVLDIGANDGTLLRSYQSRHLIRVGFEPASNLIPEAEVFSDKIINNFFNYSDFHASFHGKKAKIITSIAMFYDLEKPNRFVADIAKILAKNGIWVNQMAYLPSMLELNAFDNICHEHIEYYSLLSLENLLRRHGLEVFDVELNDVNGGSFRVYIKHKGLTFSPFINAQDRINTLRKKEKDLLLDTMKPYQEFEQRVLSQKHTCVDFIQSVVKKGKQVCVYGASTKGNTLLQYYGLTHQQIKSAAERNPSKWGLKTIGTGIPIKSEVDVRAEKPDYLLILPWHFLKEFMEREHEYLKNSGHFIVPLPNFRVI